MYTRPIDLCWFLMSDSIFEFFRSVNERQLFHEEDKNEALKKKILKSQEEIQHLVNKFGMEKKMLQRKSCELENDLSALKKEKSKYLKDYVLEDVK